MRKSLLALCAASLTFSVVACKPGAKGDAQKPAPVDAGFVRKPLVPTNPQLKAALAVYAQDAGARPAVIEALVQSLPLLAVDLNPAPLPTLPDGGRPDDIPATATPPRYLVVETDGGTLLPAFTDLDALHAFAPDAGFTALAGHELIYVAKFERYAGILLNIASPEKMAITAREVETISAVLPPPKMKPMRDDFELGDAGAGIPKHEGH